VPLEQLGQGRENAKSFLVENPEVMVEISEKVMVAAGLRQVEGAENEVFTEADEQPIEIE